MNKTIKHLITYGSVIAAISSFVTAAYAGANWFDSRYAKTQDMKQFQVDNCKKIEELQLRTTQTEIFKLEVRKAEAESQRVRRPAASTGNQIWFTPVDSAMLNRFKQDEVDINRRLKRCATQ